MPTTRPHIDVEDELVKLLKLWRMRKKPWPAMMPKELDAAAHWWVWMQEPANPRFDKAHQEPLQGKLETEYTWRFPYIDRLRFTLNAFLKLSKKRQTRVVAAREEGFWWRGEVHDVWFNGEKVWHFDVVLREYLRQKMVGAVKYQRECIQRMRELKVGADLPYDKDKWITERDK